MAAFVAAANRKSAASQSLSAPLICCWQVFFYRMAVNPATCRSNSKWRVGTNKMVMIGEESFSSFHRPLPHCISCDHRVRQHIPLAATKHTTRHLNNNRPRNFLLIIINKNRMQIDELGVWCFDRVPCWCVQTHSPLSSISMFIHFVSRNHHVTSTVTAVDFPLAFDSLQKKKKPPLIVTNATATLP